MDLDLERHWHVLVRRIPAVLPVCGAGYEVNPLANVTSEAEVAARIVGP